MGNNVLDKNFYSHIKEILENARRKHIMQLILRWLKHIGK
mgnify:CR=1 FL=1